MGADKSTGCTAETPSNSEAEPKGSARTKKPQAEAIKTIKNANFIIVASRYTRDTKSRQPSKGQIQPRRKRSKIREQKQVEFQENSPEEKTNSQAGEKEKGTERSTLSRHLSQKPEKE